MNYSQVSSNVSPPPPSPFSQEQPSVPQFTPPPSSSPPSPPPFSTGEQSTAPITGQGGEDDNIKLIKALEKLTKTILKESEKEDAPPSPFAPSTQPSTPQALPPDLYRDSRGRVRERDSGRFAPRERLREEGLVPTGIPSPYTPSTPYTPSNQPYQQQPLISHAQVRRGFERGRNLYGASNLESAFSQVPYIGGLLSQGIGTLRNLGMQASGMELSAIQAQNAFLNRSAGGQTFPQMAISSQVNNLSTRLGISPQQAVNTLKGVGLAQGNNPQLGVREIEGLTLMGYDPLSVAGMAGQLGAFGVQGNVLEALGGARGLRGQQRTQFAQGVIGFATGRVQAGFGAESVSDVVSRVHSMGGNVMANLQTMQRARGLSVRSAGGLTSAFGGVAEATLQAYAMEQAGGDLIGATRILEDMTGEDMYTAMLESGMDEKTAQEMLIAGGQLTTRDVERITQQDVFGADPKRLRLERPQQEGLRASRAFAQKQQRDLSLAFSTPKGSTESLTSRLETLLQQESKFQQSQLAKVPDSQMITGLSDAMITFNDTINEVAVPTLQAIGNGISNLNAMIGKLVNLLGGKNLTTEQKAGIQRRRQVVESYRTMSGTGGLR